jgi:hypothetical protein
MRWSTRAASRAASAATRRAACAAFTLKDGNLIREQLLTLDDREYRSTYCIVEATVPAAALRGYVSRSSR